MGEDTGAGGAPSYHVVLHRLLLDTRNRDWPHDPTCVLHEAGEAGWRNCSSLRRRAVFRIVTIEREYGCGGGAIARQLADRLGWKLWDRSLTEEIAGMAKVDCSAVERQGERLDSRFYRLAKVFWRGSYERAMPLDDTQTFDADCMVAM